VESLLKFDINYTHICIANNTYLVY